MGRRFEPPGWALIALMTLALGVAIWAVAGNSLSGDNKTSVEISADNIAFDRDEIVLKLGEATILVFNNNDSVPHAFTVDELGYGIEMLAYRKQSVSLTFTPDEIGNFAFYCKLHPTAMTGTLTVKQ